jgi:hypothetical protein
MRISQRDFIKEAGIKEEKRARGINFDYAKGKLSSSGGEPTKEAIINFLKENTSELPLSEDLFLRIKELNFSEQSRKRINEKEAFFLIIGIVVTSNSKEEDIRKIELINWYLEFKESSPGSIPEASFQESGDIYNLIKDSFERLFESIEVEKQNAEKKEEESKNSGYKSNQVVFGNGENEFNDGWKVVYVPAVGEMEEYPGAPGTSYDRILEGNKNGLCLGERTKYYQSNAQGKIFSVRDPNNDPQVTIRILDNKLLEAKGKNNLAPSVEGAIHAKKFFESIKDLNYENDPSFRDFPPISKEIALEKFKRNSYYAYKKGWIISWYNKGIKEIDDDVLNKIKNNDPDVLVLSSKYKELVEPVVKYYISKFSIDHCLKRFNISTIKTYKKMPEMISFISVAAEEEPIEFVSKGLDTIPDFKQYADIARRKYAEEDSNKFILEYEDEPWAAEYIEIAKENLMRKNPTLFIQRYKENDWKDTPNYSIRGAEKQMATYSPYTFILEFLEHEYGEEFAETAIEAAIRRDSDKFLKLLDDYYFVRNIFNLFDEDRKRKFIDDAKKCYVTEHFESFLSGVEIPNQLEKEYQKGEGELFSYAIEKFLFNHDNDQVYLILQFARKQWIKPFINSNIQELKEIALESKNSILRFKDCEWANEKRDELGGNSLIDIATGLPSEKIATLSKALRSMGLIKEATMLRPLY